jgi:hypothetical protein
VRVISLLRSAVTGPRQRPVGALAILTVIVGVVTMHSMSGSTTSHVHAVPHDASVVATDQVITRPLATDQVATAWGVVAATATEQLTASAVVMPVAETTDSHSADEQGPGACEGCCGDGLATAMCLMILVAILALVMPARRLLWRAPFELAMSLTSALAGVRALTGPSLHDLCISRT